MTCILDNSFYQTENWYIKRKLLIYMFIMAVINNKHFVLLNELKILINCLGNLKNWTNIEIILIFN